MAVRQRVAAHRARMRARGLRPIQIWVPDVRSATFAAEAARQSRRIASVETDEQDFIEEVSVRWDEE